MAAPPSLSRSVITILLLLNLAFRLGAALQPIEHVDSIAFPDDTYLCLSISRSIAEGNGPSYSGEFTNGFQPLYVYLMAPAFMLFPQDDIIPIRIAVVMLSLFDTLTLLLLLSLVMAVTRAAAVPLIIAAAWIINPAGITTAINGMETSVASFMLLMMLWVYHRFTAAGDPLTDRRSLLLGLVFGLGVFARIDAVMLAGALTVMIIWRSRSVPAAALRTALLIAAGAAVTYGPWFVYSWMNSGDLFPVSGKAIRFMELDRAENVLIGSTWYRHTVTSALTAIFRNNAAVLIIISVLLFPAAALLSGMRERLRVHGPMMFPLFLVAGTLYTVHVAVVLNSFATFRVIQPFSIITIVLGSSVYIPFLLYGSELGAVLRRHAMLVVPLLLFAAGLFIGYAYYIFGVWFFPRYLFPVGIVALVVAALVLDVLVRSLHGVKFRRLLFAFIILVIGGVNIGANQLPMLYTPTPEASNGYMKIGLWAKEQFREGTVIGSCQSGALGYFARQCRVVNLDGVVNKRCFEALQAGTIPAFLRSERIDYVIGWPLNMAFLSRRSDTPLMGHLSPVKDVPDIVSWSSNWVYYQVFR
ncbi:MAG: hypothetical protein HUU02_02790 [Bacteroidetes bacterium]|nr:hypothetical protein [Bacteroidota bacterium]